MREPFLSSSWHRVAPLRARLHLHATVTRHRGRGRSWYSVRNDATGETYRFTTAVYLFLGLLDGARTVGEAWEVVAERLDGEAPAQDGIIRLLARLHDADLLQTDDNPDFHELVARRRRRLWGTFWQRLGNPMALRLPLWDPDRFLSRHIRVLAPLPGWAALALWAGAVLPALVLAGTHFDELTRDVGDRVLSSEGLMTMLVVFPLLKALHEMGHAVAVKAGGGAVHEMGLMFLVLLPIPYVDASAASSFRSRWRRAGVGAAGMLVETFVAALALFAWLEVEPGPLRAACYATMVIAGISTVLFNANPLLRYDGYHILCDLAEVPNLAVRAVRFWTWLTQRVLFGVRRPAPPAAPGETKWFLCYAPAAFAARLAVTLSIIAVIAQRFFAVGTILAVWLALTAFVWPAARALWSVVAGPSLVRHRRRAVLVTAAALATVAAFAALVPVPLHTVGEGVVWLPREALVRAGGDGFVRVLVTRPGDQVAPGDLLIEAGDIDLDAKVATARARVRALEAQYASQQFTNRVEASITGRELDLEQSNLTDALRRVGEQKIRSEASGRLVVPRPEDLPGRFHKRGEVLGYILPDDLRVVRVLVPQEDGDLVRLRLRGVSVLLAGDLGTPYPARLIREVPAATDELPSKALSIEGGGSQAIDPRDVQTQRTLNRFFLFDVELPAPAAAEAAGAHVWVRFDHGAEPLALQAWRRMRQLFLSHFTV